MTHVGRDPVGRNYWDAIASRWNEEVFDTLRNDRDHVILDELTKCARRRRTVADFGCGVGKYLPTLSRLFDEVHGFDQSTSCVELARALTRDCANVTLHVGSRLPRAVRGAFDVTVCVNAAVHPRQTRWSAVLRNSLLLLRPGGWLIVVVPAIESARILERVFGDRDDFRIESAATGVVRIGGTPTKHFARVELRRQLTAFGARACRVRRVEYSWASHGVYGRDTRQAGKPWDWLAVARRPDPHPAPGDAAARAMARVR